MPVRPDVWTRLLIAMPRGGQTIPSVLVSKEPVRVGWGLPYTHLFFLRARVQENALLSGSGRARCQTDVRARKWTPQVGLSFARI